MKTIFNKKTILTAYVREQKLLVLAAFVFGFLSIFFILITPLFLGKFYQLVMDSDSARGKIFNAIFGKIEAINEFIVLFILILVLKFILGYFQSLTIGFLNESFSKYLREVLFKNQLNTKLQEFEKKDVGNYLIRYSGDMRSITKFFTKGIIGFTNDLLFIILTLSIFYWINHQLTLIILLFFPILFICIYFLNLKMKKISSKQRDKRSQILSFVTSRLSSLLTIKALNRTNVEFTKFQGISNEQFQLGKKYFLWLSLVENALPFLLYTMLCALFYSAYQINHSTSKVIDGAEILVFIMMTVNIIPVLRRVLKVNIIWQNGTISFRKLLVILNMKSENRSHDVTFSKSKEQAILFENVSFAYNREKDVLKNFNLSIQNCGVYHLKGSEGSGKGTIHKLLLGLYEPSQGKIMLNGINVNEIDTVQLRKSIAFASDDLTLIGKTIFEAVSYSRKDENKRPVMQFLVLLGFFESNTIEDEALIQRKIQGMSSSERKTLMLARAFLTDKKILLLDEPFIGLQDRVKENLINLIHDQARQKIILITSKENDTFISYNEKYSID